MIQCSKNLTSEIFGLSVWYGYKSMAQSFKTELGEVFFSIFLFWLLLLLAHKFPNLYQGFIFLLPLHSHLQMNQTY